MTLHRRRATLRAHDRTAAPDAAASCSRPCRSASGTTSATTARSRRAARSSAARSTSASRTSTSRTTTARRTARPRRPSAGCCASDLAPYRDELVISTKAGYDMWPGPYGEWGSRKYLLASLDQSLRRMGLDYVDIFYSHRFDPDTPLEETMGALDTAVRQGKALYAGHLVVLARADARGGGDPRASSGTPLLIHQPSYSMLNRWIEDGAARRARRARASAASPSRRSRRGCSPTGTSDGIPEGSRAEPASSLSARTR